MSGIFSQNVWHLFRHLFSDESKPVRNGEVLSKLRGMAVMFQEEMSRDARQAGEGRSH
jgi:hypothetical protein